MGVLPCSRKNCPRIMCDRYSEKHGYICDDCFDELVKTGCGTDIGEFLLTEPGHAVKDEYNSAWDSYDNEFKKDITIEFE